MLEALVPEPWPPLPAPWPTLPFSPTCGQGREAPRRVRAYNSAEMPWQLSISIVNTNTELAGISAPMARPP